MTIEQRIHIDATIRHLKRLLNCRTLGRTHRFWAKAALMQAEAALTAGKDRK